MSDPKSNIERRQQLSPAKKALLEKKLQQALSTQISGSMIPARPGEQDSPLSFSQEQIYFLHQLEPNSPRYNRPLALNLAGPLKVNYLVEAVQGVIYRHSILRSCYPYDNRGLTQTTVMQPVFSLQEIDLSGWPELEQERQLQELLKLHSQKPFDLTQSIPLRGSLFILNPNQHILLLVFHHIVFDGWSASVFIKDLSAFYTACINDSQPSLPPLPIEYGDYAAWQQQNLSGLQIRQQLAYWRNQLSNLPGGLSLPFDYPRPVHQSYQGAKIYFHLSGEMISGFKVFCLEQNSTLFMGLLASFGALMYRYTRQKDFILGSPSAGRMHLETESLIGCFLNTLPLRIKVEETFTFIDLIRQVQQTVVGAFTHQDVPFEMIVQELNPVRNLSSTPLFQVLFNLENIAPVTIEAGPVKIEVYEFDDHINRYDLSVELTPDDTGFFGHITYNTSLFEETTIRRLAEHWEILLTGIVSDPSRRILSISLLTDEEKSIWFDASNTVDHHANEALCIHQLFEQQVRRTPEKTALVFDSTCLSYHEVNQIANQLAHRLIDLGVTRETPVGVCLLRSTQMVISLLAILKAGGAYVPLDPELPPARLESILISTLTPLVITQADLVDSLPVFKGQVLYYDEAFTDTATLINTNPDVECSSEDLAYIIFTSGSTGIPKGVQAVHRGITNYLAFLQNEIGLASQDTVLQVTAFQFDPHARDIYGPLTCGAKLVLLSPKQAKDPQALVDSIRKHQVTCLLNIVPTWLRLLSDQAAQSGDPLPSLRLVLCGGEILYGTDIHRAATAFGDQVQFFNQYGPTEYTMASTCFRVPPGTLEAGPLAIGKPIWNTRVYILDDGLNPVPTGIPGEIHLAGAGLTRGYLSDPELTKSHFIRDPFTSVPRALLYKTGDLGRYNADSSLQFLGRIDRQVKIRGQRIEPGEIEAVLRVHPGVLDCAIKAYTLSSGDTGLVVYWVAKPETTASVTQLQTFLRQRVPEAMIPAKFQQMETLPRLPNGKVDLEGLQLDSQIFQNENSQLTLPVTYNEQHLAAIWENLLGTAPIGIHDNFFNLGGHSILVLKLFQEIEKEFRLRLPLALIFNYPTIAGLARQLVPAVAGIDQPDIVLLQPLGDQPPFFYLHTQHSYSSTILQLAKTAGEQQPFYAVQIPLPTMQDAQRTTLEEVTLKTMHQIQEIQPEGPYFLGGYSLSGIFAFDLACQLTQASQEVALLAVIDTRLTSLPGYFNLLSFPHRALYKAGHFLYAMNLHLQNLKRLSFQEKLNYFWERMAKNFARFSNNEPAPAAEANLYLEYRAILRQLIRGYPLHPYPGHVVLIKSREKIEQTLEPGWFFERETSGWKKVAGSVEIFPIQGDHLSIIQEENIGHLAGALAACIHNAQIKKTLNQELRSEDSSR